MAGRHGLVRVLDIDYRPVLWGLAGRGDGETRYVASAEVSRRLQAELGQFELIIGTEEEWLIAGGVEGDLIASLRRVRECSRSEEHTSELQSQSNLVCRLLLEKKKNKKT